MAVRLQSNFSIWNGAKLTFLAQFPSSVMHLVIIMIYINHNIILLISTCFSEEWNRPLLNVSWNNSNYICQNFPAPTSQTKNQQEWKLVAAAKAQILHLESCEHSPNLITPTADKSFKSKLTMQQQNSFSAEFLCTTTTLKVTSFCKQLPVKQNKTKPKNLLSLMSTKFSPSRPPN